MVLGQESIYMAMWRPRFDKKGVLMAPIHFLTPSYDEVLPHVQTVSDGGANVSEGHRWWAHYNTLADTSTNEENAELLAYYSQSWEEQEKLQITLSSAFLGWYVHWRKGKYTMYRVWSGHLGLIGQSQQSILGSRNKGGVHPVWHAI